MSLAQQPKPYEVDVKVPPPKLLSFAKAVLVAAGTDTGDAKAVSRILLWADSVGLTEQGVQRLPILCRRVEAELIRSPMRSSWNVEQGAVASLNAGDGFGHVAAELGALRAIELATTHGIGAVTVANSNYFGAAGYFAWLMSQSGMVGLVASNSFPKVAAHGGIRPVLGTNPIAFAAPTTGDHPLLLDMATAAAAGSEIRRRAEAGIPLDPGMAVDEQGEPLLDASQLARGAALPFGGAKGFGVMLLVEILSGVLTGGAIGSDVKSMYQNWEQPGRSGHFLLAIDPQRLLPDGSFTERMQTFWQMVECSGPNVRMPGQTRWRYYEETKSEGIDSERLPIAQLRELGEKYRVSAEFLTIAT